MSIVQIRNYKLLELAAVILPLDLECQLKAQTDLTFVLDIEIVEEY